MLLLRLEGGVWTFRDPDKDLLYRCTVDPDGNELWSCKVILTEHEWISQVEAARLIGVTRQAIMNAIFFKRLSTIDCNEKRRVRRTEVLALEPKQPTNKFKA